MTLSFQVVDRSTWTVGILAYLQGRPVAWCSIAPRSTYRRHVYRKKLAG